MGGLAAGMPGKFALASAWKTVATVLCIASDHDTGAVVPAPTSSIRAKVQAWNYVLGAPQINEIPIVSTLGKILVKEVVEFSNVLISEQAPASKLSEFALS